MEGKQELYHLISGVFSLLTSLEVNVGHFFNIVLSARYAIRIRGKEEGVAGTVSTLMAVGFQLILRLKIKHFSDQCSSVQKQGS